MACCKNAMAVASLLAGLISQAGRLIRFSLSAKLNVVVWLSLYSGRPHKRDDRVSRF
jgi:hypothetical protein